MVVYESGKMGGNAESYSSLSSQCFCRLSAEAGGQAGITQGAEGFLC